jgi:hypothetical protein
VSIKVPAFPAHSWELKDGVGDPRRPVFLKHVCTKCEAIYWIVCGVPVFHPEGENGPLPCK